MDTSVDATSLLILCTPCVSSPNSCVHKLTWEGSNPLLRMPQCHAYVISIATIAFMRQTSRYCCILFKDFMNNYYNDSSAYTCYDHMLQLVHLLAVMKLKPTTSGMGSSGPKFGRGCTVTLISQNPACSNDLEMRSFDNCNSKNS